MKGIHWVLNGPLKKKYGAFLETIGREIPWSEMQTIITRYPEGNVTLWIEEYLAARGEKKPDFSLRRKFFAGFRAILREAFGFDLKFTDAELEEFLYKANQRFERSKESDRQYFSESEADPKYAKSKPRGPQRSSWEEVRVGDRWNSVKKYLPKEDIDLPTFATHGSKDEVVKRAAQFLKDNATVTDWSGRLVYLPFGEADGGYSDELLNRAEHITGNEVVKGSHKRTLSTEKAKTVAAIPLTISAGKARVVQGSEVLYFRNYRGRVHMVVTTKGGLIVNQGIVDSGLVTQYLVDIKKSFEGAIVDSTN